MSDQPELTGVLAPLNTPQNTTQLSDMVQSKSEQWYVYIERIVQEHEAVQQYADFMEEEQTIMQTHLEKAQKQLNQFNHEGQLLQEQLNQTHTSVFTSDAQTLKSEKLSDSELFDGKCSELQLFLASLHLKLIHNHDQFSTASECLTYSFSCLISNIQNQILSYVTVMGVNFTDEESLFSHLELTFGDSDCKGTAQCQVQTLHQRNWEFSVYFAEFNHYVQNTEYNDEVKKSMLMMGLSEELKRLLVHSDMQNMSLQKLASHCQKLDNQYWVNLAVSSQSIWPQNTVYSISSVNCFFISTSSSSSSSVYASLSSVELMNLSAAQIRPWSLFVLKKKNWCWENRLCLYCGQPNHIATVCLFKLKITLCVFSTDSSAQAAISESSDPNSSENVLSLS